MTARDIHPLHPMLGVEITGLDVTQRLDDEEVQRLPAGHVRPPRFGAGP